MALRNIPPRTIGALPRQRIGITGLLAVARGGLPIRGVLTAPRSMPLPRRPALGIGMPGGAAHRPGRITPPTWKHGRAYARPTRAARFGELIIPPRPGSSDGTTTHAVSTTADGHLVRISFGRPTAPGSVTWELYDDVLEVECTDPKVVYHHAFIVPSGVKPIVERDECRWTLFFPSQAVGEGA